MEIIVNDTTLPIDAEYDVVVIGSGASGKSAALAAAQGGLTVAILEKLPETGGSSVFAEGTAAFESSEQKARGVPDDAGAHFPSREEGFRRYTDYSHLRANPDVVRVQVENTAETIDLYKSLGITYTDVSIYAYDQPYELYTFHRPDGLGAHCQEVLLKAVEDAGVEIFTATPAQRLVVEDGAVTGVIAQDSDGSTLRIAAKAVVLASGGFGNNPDLVEKYSWFRRTAHDMYQCVPTANTGDGLTMALAAGADTECLGALMIAACARGKMLTSHTSGAGSQPGLWVNKTGRRFASEEVAMSFADSGNTMAKQPDATVYAIIDQATVTHLMEEGSDIGLGDFIPYHAKLDHLQAELDEDVAIGRAWKADTIDGLATAVGLDPAVLVQTVADYNDACAKGADPLFFKPAKFLRAVDTAPYYVISMAGSVLVSCGGIRVNGNLQVTDASYTPIPGLYAVGLEASGLYGDTYNLDVPGTANGFAHASGRVAGRHVVSTLKGTTV
jgi:fumarate reductase flavoprotein subunit